MKWTQLSSKPDENKPDDEKSSRTLLGSFLKATKKEIPLFGNKPTVKEFKVTAPAPSVSPQKPFPTDNQASTQETERKPSVAVESSSTSIATDSAKPNPLLNYFMYLRDASKNLSLPSDWYKCLLSKKNENNLPTTVNFDLSSDFVSLKDKKVISKGTRLYPYFQSYKQIVKKDNTKHIFLGLGLVCGRFEQKKIFSSIVNIPVDFIYHERSDVFTVEIDFPNALINYDLITALLPDYFSQEYSLISEEILNSLSAFETSIEECHDLACMDENIHTFLTRFLPLLKDLNISEYTIPYRYETLASAKNKSNPLLGRALYYKEGISHFFVNRIPGKISTWQGLNSFCDQISDGIFDNEVLNNLLNNVFNIKQETLNKYSPIVVSNLNLPMSLSSKQQVAIKNAFETQVSYVQGPPGTGKSYTISAMVLASMLLGKKVLVVAQKDTAIKVVQDKILPFFDKDTVVPFIYFNKEQKRTLKNSLKKLLSKADEVTPSEVVKLEFDLREREETLVEQEERLNALNNALAVLLDKYADFYQNNQSLIKEKDTLLKNPAYEKYVKENIQATQKANDKFVKDIHDLQNVFNMHNQFNVYELNLLKHHEKLFNEFFLTKLDFVHLIRNRICAVFVKDWFALSYSIAINDKKMALLGTEDEFLNLKYQSKTLLDSIHTLKHEIFKISHKKALFENLLIENNRSEINTFEKMLHFSKDEKVADKMKKINFDNLLNVFPVWLCEIQKINEVLPLVNEMFDLVIVDESSQVDLAQILPVFYRGKNICVVGDHKQLGLESVGLNFSLNKKFDKMMWDKYSPNGLDHESAGDKNLTITKASILDLLRSEENTHRFREVMLDEHFRSLPGLADFNNKEFYDGELKIMTQTPEKTLVSCFSGICVPDGIKNDKTNRQEAEEVISVVKYITGAGTLSDDDRVRLSSLINMNSFVPRTPTIGIISLLRDQADLIDDLIDNLPTEVREKHHIVCGTPEEFQGDEFDIIIMSMVIDADSRNTGHYSNPNRFNVATSRAKFYTIAVYSHITQVPMYDKYLKHFGIVEDNKSGMDTNVMHWSYDESKFDSGFEGVVAGYINLYRTQLSRKHKLERDLEIYNQVETCGLKRLDFVIYNPNNNKSLAIEVDGIQHFNGDSRSYSEHHLERMEILTRAGWKVLNTPYFLWYKRGKLCPESLRFQKELKRIKDEMEIILIG